LWCGSTLYMNERRTTERRKEGKGRNQEREGEKEKGRRRKKRGKWKVETRGEIKENKREIQNDNEMWETVRNTERLGKGKRFSEKDSEVERDIERETVR